MKRNISILYAIALLQGMVFYAPVATLYRQAAGVGIFEITLIESISLALTILLEIPWGWAADRIGYRRTMLVCCGIYFVSKLVFWQAEDFGGFLLERVLLSVVCAGISGVDSSILYLSSPKEDTHRVFSIYRNLGEAGIVFAAGVYALWIGEDYRMAALLTAVSYGLAAVLALGLREVKPPEAERKTSLKDTIGVISGHLRNKKLIFLLAAAALVGETHQSVTVFLSQLQYIRAGMGHTMISLAYIAVSLTGLIGGLSARLCQRTGAKRMGTGLILICMACCLLMGFSPAPLLSVLAVVGLRGCFGLFQPLEMELENRLVTTRDRATALSVNSALQDGLGIALNLIFGYIAEASLPGAMLFGAVLCLVSAGFFRASFSE